MAMFNQLNFHSFFLIFFKLNFRDLICHSLEQSKNGMIIYPQNDELLSYNMETMINVQFNYYINIMAVMREHEFHQYNGSHRRTRIQDEGNLLHFFYGSDLDTFRVFRHISGGN